MENKITIVAYLLIKNNIVGVEKIEELQKEILTYLPHVDMLYIFNYAKDTQKTLLDVLVQYKNIEYADLENRGQVRNYKDAIRHAIKKEADFAVVLEPGYFYEDDSFHEIKKKIYMNEFSDKDAVITPMPVFTCEQTSQLATDKRNIKGAHLTGAFINLHIYKLTDGFVDEYYQTTFDYDYCLTVRQKGYNVVLMNNLRLRNKNYKVLQKNILWHSFHGYKKDLYDIYYETRNRLYLWNKFKNFDPEYIKIDKKQQALEFREIRLFDKPFKEKKQIIIQARLDYSLGRMGKAFEELKF